MASEQNERFHKLAIKVSKKKQRKGRKWDVKRAQYYVKRYLLREKKRLKKYLKGFKEDKDEARDKKGDKGSDEEPTDGK